MTKQRRVILEELRKVDTHPTADRVYAMVRKRLPRISLGTVYRNLEVLSEAGEIQKLESAGTQKRFDGNAEPHLHIRCLVCGKVADAPPGVDLPDVPGCHESDFHITGVRVECVGYCPNCHN
jgi:Fur family ferric uptake transcriptional regulator